jgi:hypothetical protein
MHFGAPLSEQEFFRHRVRVEQRINATVHGARFHAFSVGVLLLLAATGLVTANLGGGNLHDETWRAVMRVALPAQALIACRAFFLFRLQSNAREMLRRECGPFPVTQDFEFDEDGFTFTFAGARIHHPWSRLRACDRDNEALYRQFGIFWVAIAWKALAEEECYTALATRLATRGFTLPPR